MKRFSLLPAAGLCALLALPRAVPARAQTTALAGSFWTAAGGAMAARGWTLHGVQAVDDDTVALSPSSIFLPCRSSDIDGGDAAYDAVSGLCAGRDPYPAGGYKGRDYYNGARFAYGTILSPQIPSALFDSAVVSWVAQTPPGTWLQAHLRVRVDNPSTGASNWTSWAALPIWASDVGTVHRHAAAPPAHAHEIDVRTDTLVVRHGQLASGFQVAVTLFTASDSTATGYESDGITTPTLRRISVALARSGSAAPAPAPRSTSPSRSPAWGYELAVPPRSQMLARFQGAGYGGGGEVWCSPTSTSMILAYWARALGRPDLDIDVPATARDVYDWTYEGTGNWPFNVAYATGYPGMDGYVARFPSLDALEPWIAAGVPLALSVAFAPGGLPGAPIPATNGHIIVLRGFDRAGNPIVNDPAAPDDGTVRHVYPRAAFERAWLDGSGGTAYVIYPRGWAVPSL